MNYESWLKEWYGSLACACDYGCNQWILTNAGKAYKLMISIKMGATETELDNIVNKEIKEINKEFLTEMRERAKAHREDKE